MPVSSTLVKLTKLGLIAAALSLPCTSFAGTIIISIGGTTVAGAGMVSSQAGATMVNFDTGAPAYYSIVAPAQLGTGTSAGLYSAPTGDTTQFLSTANSSVVITPPSAYNYFGIYWGSIDSYNSITFLESDGTSVTYTGTQINAAAGNAVSGATSDYVNFMLSGATFSRITLSSSNFSFESDNHAFALVGTPEPSTFALLAGCLGAAFLVKRRVQAPVKL